uniref:Uncharacterized protein n=1 Tax=Utricularia reniformis TaxID=192314 RepID=A0A1Y0B0H5_9LAMI|nr:hypothetical protein AEK19_MT0619 [Utricularia reniformis]ART30874.1 hypothetical protein AEK19_MT0619 [Utricularia reniformis]
MLSNSSLTKWKVFSFLLSDTVLIPFRLWYPYPNA